MTQDQIDELRRLDRAATPAPWTPHESPLQRGVIVGQDRLVAHLFRPIGTTVLAGQASEPALSDANAALAIKARNTVVKLLDEREMLLSAVRQMRAAAQLDDNEGWMRALEVASEAEENAQQ